MGYLPTTNLGISAIKTELVNGSNSLNTLAADAGVGAAMSNFRGYRLPPATITMTQNAGGIWDGCNFHDTWCELSSTDPDFNTIQAFYSPGGFTTNTERGNNEGTFLTFGGGTVTTSVHGRYSVTVYNTFGPVYAGVCTFIYINIIVNAAEVAFGVPVYGDYKTISYTFTATPGANYNIECNVNY